MISVRLQ